MIDVGVTRMSTKGQIVIPLDLRDEFQIGEKLFVIKSKDQLIIKKVSDLDETLKEDLEFARRTEDALQRYEKGEFKEMNFDDFIEKSKKW